MIGSNPEKIRLEHVSHSIANLFGETTSAHLVTVHCLGTITRVANFDAEGLKPLRLDQSVGHCGFYWAQQLQQTAEFVSLWEFDLMPREECLEILLGSLLGMESNNVAKPVFGI